MAGAVAEAEARQNGRWGALEAGWLVLGPGSGAFRASQLEATALRQGSPEHSQRQLGACVGDVVAGLVHGAQRAQRLLQLGARRGQQRRLPVHQARVAHGCGGPGAAVRGARRGWRPSVQGRQEAEWLWRRPLPPSLLQGAQGGAVRRGPRSKPRARRGVPEITPTWALQATALRRWGRARHLIEASLISMALQCQAGSAWAQGFNHCCVTCGVHAGLVLK